MKRKTKPAPQRPKKFATTETVATPLSVRPPNANTGTLEDVVADTVCPDHPITIREAIERQLQYDLGLDPVHVRSNNLEMHKIIQNPEAKDRDKIEANNSLLGWKKEIRETAFKIGDWLREAGEQRTDHSEVSDEQLLQGLRLLSAEPTAETAAPAAAVAVDDEEILPLEGVG